MYKNSDINSLVVDDSNRDYVSLYLPCKKNKQLYPKAFQNINDNDLFFSKATDYKKGDE